MISKAKICLNAKMEGKESQTTRLFQQRKLKLINSNSCDLEFIFNDFRKRIIKWQRKQDCIKVLELREYEHYTVNCQLDSFNQLDVSVSCEMCKNKYKLNHKTEGRGNTVVMISNWTSHIKKCIAKAEKNSGHSKQVIISKFVKKVHNDSVTNKDILPEDVVNHPINISDDISKQITSDLKDDCIVTDTSLMPKQVGSTPQRF